MSVRVLCLGNDLLADDAFGHLVADRLASIWPPVEAPATRENTYRPGQSVTRKDLHAPALQKRGASPSAHAEGKEHGGATAGVEVVKSSLAGLGLLDELTGVSRLIVIDSVQTGNVPPGTIHILREDELKTPAGPSPHYFGITESLKLARHLGLPTPEEVTIVAVETADCTTLGGPTHPAVLAAVPKVVRRVAEMAAQVSH